jgi:hypothetical protein
MKKHMKLDVRDRKVIEHALVLLINMESEFITEAEKERAKALRNDLRSLKREVEVDTTALAAFFPDVSARKGRA